MEPLRFRWTICSISFLVLLMTIPLNARGQSCRSEPEGIDAVVNIWPYHPQLMKRLIAEEGEKGMDRLLTLARDLNTSSSVRGKAISILAEMRESRVLDILLQELNSKEFACLALSYIEYFHDPRSIPLLTNFLDDNRICGEVFTINTSGDRAKEAEVFASDSAVNALEAITGLSFEVDKDLRIIGHRATKPWKEWWEQNRIRYATSPEDFLAPQKSNRTRSSTSYPCAVQKIAISPDGMLVFSGSKPYDGKVRVWNLETRSQRWAAVGHTDDVTGAAFSPDGKIIASSSSDGSLMIWDAISGTRIRVILNERMIEALAFSPDGRSLAVAYSDDSIKIWNTSDWCLIRDINNSDFTVSIAFNPDGSQLATALFEKVRVWDLRNGKEILSLAIKPAKQPKSFADVGEARAQLWRMAWNVAYSPDGKMLVGGSGAAIHLWDSLTGKELASVPSKGEVNGLIFTPDGQWVLWGNDNDQILMWNIKNRKVKKIKNFASTGDIVMTPNGRHVLSPGAGKEIQIYDVKMQKAVGTLECDR